MGAAAARGELDTDLLRGLDPDAAVEYLTSLPGIDRAAAETILCQGAGLHDRLPADDLRLARAVRMAYGHGADLATLAPAWRPYGRWVAFLLCRWLDDRRRIRLRESPRADDADRHGTGTGELAAAQ
jgi:3-methyladenine DNA glycosylase/8-oxoguanine DNA glycosylase